jgi:hypothetical protein
MNRALAVAALLVFSIPPVAAVAILLRALRGEPDAPLKTGVACAAATSLIWSFLAGGAVILGWPSSLLAIPGLFCLLVGGACAWKLEGSARWLQLGGAAFFAVLPLLLTSTHVSSAAKSLRRPPRPVAGPAQPAP